MNIKNHGRRIASLALSLLLAGAFAIHATVPPVVALDTVPDRGLFVTSYGKPDVFFNAAEIRALIDFAKRSGITVLFVQVYRENMTWFPSSVGDPSKFEAAFRSVGENPVTLLIEEAHRQGIRVHAWMNLLSLGSNQNAPLLKKYGADILTRNLKKKETLRDYKIDGHFFLEPGDPRVRAELSQLVREILSAYPSLDGLQFDYIRYPDWEPHYGYGPANVARFRKTTGCTQIDDASELWRQWKRDQVTDLLTMLVTQARAMNPALAVSTTGCMPHARALREAFQDWPAWINDGIVDFVTVMNYTPAPDEFERWNRQIKTNIKDFKKVFIAVGAYKPATTAGVFRREFESCEASGAGACVVFYYGSLLQKPGVRKFFAGSM